MPFSDLREFLDFLKDEGELSTIDIEIDPYLEIGAVGHLTRMGPAVLFTNVKGSDKKVAINILGTRKRIALALGIEEKDVISRLAYVYENPIKPVIVSDGPCKENILKGEAVDMGIFPVPQWNDKDGGKFSDFGICLTKDPETGFQNAGMYRQHIKGKKKTGVYAGDKSHIGMHYKKAKEMGLDYLEMAVAIGLDPAVNMVGPCPAEYGLNEFDLAGGLRQEPVQMVKAETVDIMVPATAEIILEGRIPIGVYEEEGPFGEFTGYYSGTYQHPVFEITAITHRDNPIFQGTYLAKMPTEGHVLPETFNSAMIYAQAKKNAPEIAGVYCFDGTWALMASVSMKKEFEGQIHQVANAFFATHVGKWTKVLVIVDDDINVYDKEDLVWAMMSRYQPEFDTYVIPRVAGIGIDPSERVIKSRGIETGGVSNLSSRIIIDATRSLERTVMGEVVKSPVITSEVEKRLKDNRIELKKY
ncbi:MAG: UbiD family decarboxylase [Thermodesulfobacteriota bacterium]|nr:UbiD family decarboxylase [Thermodesulfobacteriota bacterium]